MTSTVEASGYKRPESVLVLVYNQEVEVLVLERREPPGFFQSVTGSLEPGESAADAAARELFEETGLSADSTPRETGLSARFEILPAWRHRFPPGTTHNHERVFCHGVAGRPRIRLNEAEHRGWEWLPFDRALARLSSWTNRRAVLQILPLRVL